MKNFLDNYVVRKQTQRHLKNFERDLRYAQDLKRRGVKDIFTTSSSLSSGVSTSLLLSSKMTQNRRNELLTRIEEKLKMIIAEFVDVSEFSFNLTDYGRGYDHTYTELQVTYDLSQPFRELESTNQG